MSVNIKSKSIDATHVEDVPEAPGILISQRFYLFLKDNAPYMKHIKYFPIQLRG